MILIDTSVWIDHFRSTSAALTEVLAAEEVLTHPFVIGELACGMLRQRAEVLRLLGRLPGKLLGRFQQFIVDVDRGAHAYKAYII